MIIINSRFKPWYIKEINWLKDNIDILGTRECSKILGRDIQVIRVMRRKGYKLHKKYWFGEELEILKENYSKTGAEDLSKTLTRFTREQIRVQATHLGLYILPSVLSKIKKRLRNNSPLTKVEYENFAKDFISVSSPYHAYILGFLWADGHVCKDRTRVTCSVAIDDGEILKNIFLRTGKWNINTRYCNNPKAKKIMCFNISNDAFHEFLTENDYQIKSGTSACKILSKIPKNFRHYWLRGYFDGDGHIQTSGYAMNIASVRHQDWKFMVNICEDIFVKFQTTIESEMRNSKSVGTGRFRVRGAENFIKFFNYIYQGLKRDNIGLIRKYNRFLDKINRIKKNFTRIRFNNSHIVLELANNI